MKPQARYRATVNDNRCCAGAAGTKPAAPAACHLLWSPRAVTRIPYGQASCLSNLE